MLSDVQQTKAMRIRARKEVESRFSLQAEYDGIAAVYRQMWRQRNP